MFVVILFFILALSTQLAVQPAEAKEPLVCASNANKIVEWVQLRDNGVTKEQLLEAFDYSVIPPKFRVAVQRDIKQEVDRVYSDWHKQETPMELAKDYFFRCLDQPNYVEETEV